MSIKMTGAEYKKFVAASWDEDCDLYMDDMCYELNGKPFDEEDADLELILADADRLVILSGRLCRNSDLRFSQDFVTFARKWLKAQTKSCVVFEIDKDQVEALKLIAAERFGKAVRVLS